MHPSLFTPRWTGLAADAEAGQAALKQLRKETSVTVAEAVKAERKAGVS